MNQIVQYHGNGICLDARIEGTNVWVTADQAAELFGCSADNIRKHARQIVQEKELDSSVGELLSLTASDGKTYQVQHWNQDMVMHIGYRVRSDRGSEFRRWATMVLKGEAPPLTPAVARPMTQAELIVASANMLLELERKQAAQDRRLEALEASVSKADAELDSALALPESTVDAPEKTTGMLVVQLTRAWAATHGDAYQEAFGLLYREVECRLRIGLKRREKSAKAKGMRISDVIDATGKAAEVYAIARQLFAAEGLVVR